MHSNLAKFSGKDFHVFLTNCSF